MKMRPEWGRGDHMNVTTCRSRIVSAKIRSIRTGQHVVLDVVSDIFFQKIPAVRLACIAKMQLNHCRWSSEDAGFTLYRSSGAYEMIVSELIAQKTSIDVKSIEPDGTLLRMAEILVEENIGVLMVLDIDGTIAGVASERDLARALVRFPLDIGTRVVREIMTTTVISCDLNDNVVDILDRMTRCGIRHIPVLENGALKAVLSIREFNLAYQRLQAQVRTDYMTGLSNRRHFMDLLKQEINRRSRFGAPLSVIMIDIDEFKKINDTYGHDVGDQVICALADLLKSECRVYDLLSRLGGEEYAVLCPNTNLAGATVVCRRLLDGVRRQRVSTSAGEIRFTASFGLYETTEQGEDTKTIMKKVDGLLYRAKREGRNRMVAGNSAGPA